MKDRRTKIERHWEGKHSRECRIYSLAWCGNVCRYTGEPFRAETDLMARMGLDFRVKEILIP